MDKSTLHSLRQLDHTALQTILTALNGAKNALRRDACGDWTIQGSRGEIRSYNDQFAIYLACHSAKAWTFAKKQLAPLIQTISQDGDDEGIFILRRIPEEDEVALLRHYIGLRQTRDAPQNSFHPG
jgi:hypothetical protein